MSLQIPRVGSRFVLNAWEISVGLAFVSGFEAFGLKGV